MQVSNYSFLVRCLQVYWLRQLAGLDGSTSEEESLEEVFSTVFFTKSSQETVILFYQVKFGLAKMLYKPDLSG